MTQSGGTIPSDPERSRLLHTNYHALSRFVQARLPADLRRLTDAEDILQETFIEAWRYGASSYKAHASSSSIVWLRTVAKRKIIDWVRRHSANKRAGDRAISQETPKCHLASTKPRIEQLAPSSNLEREEAERILSDALAELSRRHRTAIRLRFFEQLPFDDVGTELGVSSKAAQMIVKRATLKLKRIIGRQSRVMS